MLKHLIETFCGNDSVTSVRQYRQRTWKNHNMINKRSVTNWFLFSVCHKSCTLYQSFLSPTQVCMTGVQPTRLWICSSQPIGKPAVSGGTKVQRFRLSLFLVKIKRWRKLPVDTMIVFHPSVCVCAGAFNTTGHYFSKSNNKSTVFLVCRCRQVTTHRQSDTCIFVHGYTLMGTEVRNNTVDYISSCCLIHSRTHRRGISISRGFKVDVIVKVRRFSTPACTNKWVLTFSVGELPPWI